MGKLRFDSLPNVRSLFRHYDELYFGSKLEACTVEWTSRRTVDPGRCIYNKEDGVCQIRLSEPILKSRSQGDVKATLLHEMIHAYLFFTVKSADRNDHGDLFQSKMNKINNSQLQDDERPEEGYHIGVTHSFKAARALHWKCQACGDTIEKDGDTAPSAADCIGKSNSSESCLRLQCRWHMHKKGCSGTSVKGCGASGHIDPQTFEEPNGKQELTNKPINKRKLELDVKSKAGEAHLKAPRLERFYAKGQITGDEQPCKSSDVKSGTSVIKGARVKRSPRRRITKKVIETTDNTSNGPSVIIGWKGWWAWEREEDEEGVESLIDRRREKRAREKESQGVMKLADECAKIQVEGTSAIEVEAEPDHFQGPDHEHESALVIWQPVIDLESPRREGAASEGERSLVLASVPTLKTYSRRRERSKGITIEANTGEVTPGETEAKCPVCQKVFVCDPNKPQDNADINTHVDECLNASFRAGR